MGDFPRILSFWVLNFASTEKSFSSEKMILPFSVPPFRRFSRILALSFLFRFWRSVRSCLVLILYGDILRSCSTIVLTDSWLIFMSLAVFLKDHLGFLRILRILSLRALIFAGVRVDRGRPLLSQSSMVPSSWKCKIVSRTVDFGAFSNFIILEFECPAR